MTAAQLDPPRRRGNGGRPRNPSLTPRAIEGVIDLLAETGSGFTADELAAHLRCGKASLYRRWPSLDLLLVEAVHTLGVRAEDVEAGASVHHDVVAVVRASVDGRRAAAERAVLSLLPYRTELRVAYAAGPAASLDTALSNLATRAAARGDGDAWPGSLRIRSAIALLHAVRLTTAPAPGDEPDDVPDALELLGVIPGDRLG